jgi:4-hydroxybenzoate polyprenyltransferase
MQTLISSSIVPFIKVLRPHQWLKNIFVFAGVVFAGLLYSPIHVERAILAAIAFSFVASAVYIFNDIVDRESDKIHPAKKHRPIASGEISISIAINSGLIIGILGIFSGSLVSYQLEYILLSYILLNIAYSCYFKTIIILDIVFIAAGFVLRTLAGTSGIGIAPSHWLLICTLLLTLFLGFSKRYADYICLKETNQPDKNRYSKKFLNVLILIFAFASIVSYGIYGFNQGRLYHRSYALFFYTTPLVILGIFRYLQLIYTKKNSGLDIAQNIFSDFPLFFILVAWILATLFFQ